MKLAEWRTADLGECVSGVLPARELLRGGCAITSDTLLHKLHIIARELVSDMSAFMTSKCSGVK